LVPWDPIVPGGVTEVIANLYREVELGGEFEPILLVNRWSARRPTEAVTQGRRTIYFRIASPVTGGTFRGLAKWLVTSPLLFFDLWRLCRRYQIAVFNVQYPSLGSFSPALLRALRLYRGRIILSFHGLDLVWARDSGRFEAMLWRFVLRHSDAAVACSAAFAQDVRRFAAGRTPVAVIHNGLDVDYLLESTVREPDILGRLEGRDFILAVGKLEERKGLDVLIRAFATLRRDKARLALVLLGQAGDAAERLRALTAELGLGDDVFFYDAVPHTHVGAFVERAKVICLPSRSETFGIVLLEAGAFRRPVVATRVGGIPEVVQDGESGLLVEPDDPEALAKALARVLSDPSLARALGERLFERAETGFTWKRAYAAYRNLAAGRSSG
jgi:glycosyltransferase involved in cell wall biosynthesis